MMCRKGCDCTFLGFLDSKWSELKGASLELDCTV